MTLSDLKPGKIALVEQVQLGRYGQGLTNRLEAMGIIANRPVVVLRKAWFGGPLHVRVGTTTEVAIRRSEAAMVRVRSLENQ